MQWVLDGYSPGEVAEFLGVDPRSVRRGVAAYRQEGRQGLLSRPAPGRPPKLSITQEKIVRRWVADKPTEHGFATDLWTGPRRASLIHQAFGVRFHPWYLSAWRRDRGFTPQKSPRVPRQRDPDAIAAGRESDGPRLKNRPGVGGRPSPGALRVCPIRGIRLRCGSGTRRPLRWARVG